MEVEVSDRKKLVPVKSIGKKKRVIVKNDRNSHERIRSRTDRQAQHERTVHKPNIHGPYFAIGIGDKKGGGYFGAVVYKSRGLVIGAKFEPGTDGRVVDKYLLLTGLLLKKVVMVQGAWELKRLWHQLNRCECSQYPGRRCPAEGIAPFNGPTVTEDEFLSIPYFDVYQDSLDEKDDIEFISTDRRQLKSALHGRKFRDSFIKVIKNAGGFEDHHKRLLASYRSHIGEWHDVCDHDGELREHVRIAGYNPDEDQYMCEWYPAGCFDDDPSRESMEEGEDVRMGTAFECAEEIAPLDEIARKYAL
jgi:hypothetical protein